MKKQRLKHDNLPNTAAMLAEFGPLTTGDVLTPVPANVPVPENISQDTRVQLGYNNRTWVNAGAIGVGGPPGKPGFITFAASSDGTPGLTLAIGVYLLAAPTGSGKTVQSMALTAWGNASNVPSTMLCVYEPRSPEIKPNESVIFSPETSQGFWAQLKGLLSANTSQNKLIVVDSATLPLKTYAATEAFRQQSTFTGGMQPSDLGFVNEGSRVAMANSACIILVLNSTLVPYASALAGATEGLISIINVGQFSYRDRTAASARQMKTVTIPTTFVDAALAYFGYGVYKASDARFASGYEGIQQ